MHGTCAASSISVAQYHGPQKELVLEAVKGGAHDVLLTTPETYRTSVLSVRSR